MTTLASAVSIGDNQLRINAAMTDEFPGYVKIGTEILSVGGQEYRSGTTLALSEPAQAAHNSGTTVTYAGRAFDPTFVSALGAGGGAAEPGTVVVTPGNEVDIGAALDAAMVMSAAPPDASNGYVTAADVLLANLLPVSNDAGGFGIANLLDPVDPQDAATKNYVDTLAPTPALAAVLAEGNDTGGVAIDHIPAVDVDALVGGSATATGAGFADAHQEANGETGGADAAGIARAVGGGDANNIVAGSALAETVDGDAFAAIHATATGTGNTDACAYARSVDGQALADNDAAASGSGNADAGGYAVAVDGTAFTGGVATSTGSGNADASDIATANTGVATAGSLAVRGAVTVGMSAVVDGTSGRLAFNGTTPIAIQQLPATPTEQDIADVLVALGLVTQAA